MLARTRAYEERYSGARERRRAPLRAACPRAGRARCRASIPRRSVVAGAALARRAHEQVERGQRLAVRDVGGPQDLLRRHEREQVELVERRPGRAVEEDVLDAARQLADACLRHDRGVRQDQRGVRVALGHVPELERHSRRQPAAGVDQHGQAPLPGQGEDGLEATVVDAERLRARVQLDAACTQRQAALGLAQRILALVEAQPHEREEPLGLLGGPAQDAVVRCAVGRLAVRLVESEDVRGLHAGLVHETQVLRDRERMAVLVEPEMRVRVERRAAGRKKLRHAPVLRRQQLLGPLDEGGLGHPPEPIRSPHGRSHATWDRFAPLLADPLAELRRGGRPPARAVRRRHRLRHPGRAYARDLPRPGRLRDPPRVAAPRAGRGVHGRRLRAHRGQARRLHADHGRRV